ncbi:hypothetical protein HK105_201654 [Polyrhizophydium stewartii]|uniref:Uncharacterized protein n=1 Tax=Polyrhizophydium stewartii TaxID=2732419 RepID=A0ABR4NH03_9FUNG
MPPSDQDAPSSSAASSNPIATLVRRLSRKRTKQPRADTPPPVPVAEMSISGPTLVSVTKGVDLLEQLQRGQLPAVLAPAQDTTPPWNRPDADSSPLNSSALSIARRPRLLPDPAPVASAAPLLPMPDLASQILDDLLSGDPDDAADAGPPLPRGSVRRSMVRSGTGAGATAAADLAPDARAGAPIQDSPQLFRSHTLSSGSAPNEVQRHFVQMLAVAVTTSKAAAEALSVADGDARPTVSLKVSRTVDFASVLDKLALRFAAHEAASPAWKRFPGHFGKQVVAIQNITYKDADGHLINIQDEEDWAVCLDEAVLQGGITLFVDIETVLAREA